MQRHAPGLRAHTSSEALLTTAIRGVDTPIASQLPTLRSNQAEAGNHPTSTKTSCAAPLRS